MNLEVNSNAGHVSVQYAQAPRLIAKTVIPTMRRIGGGLQSYILRNKLQGDPLERRSGTLGRALFYRITVADAEREVILTIGADKKKAPQAAVQEYGGTIRPKNARSLAIPLEAARTARGLARITARRFMENPGELGYDAAFVADDVIFGVKETKNREDVDPVFALKKQVVLPERSYIRSGVRDRRDFIIEQLGGAVTAAAQKATSGQAGPDSGPVSIGTVE